MVPVTPVTASIQILKILGQFGDLFVSGWSREHTSFVKFLCSLKLATNLEGPSDSPCPQRTETGCRFHLGNPGSCDQQPVVLLF